MTSTSRPAKSQRAAQSEPSQESPTALDAQSLPVAEADGSWGGEFDVDQFGGDTEQSLKIPHCQIIPPPNVDAEMIEQMKRPYGFFIPMQQAQELEFSPDGSWQLIQHKFKGSKEPTQGYITLNPRFAVIRKSPLEVHEKGEKGFHFTAVAYNRGIEHPLVAQTRRQGSGYKLSTRMLLVLLDQNNNLLHTKSPILLSARGGAGGALGTELELFHADLSHAYFEKARSQNKRIKGDSLSTSARAYGVVQFELGYFIDESSAEAKAPYVVPVARSLPAAKLASERSDSRRGGKQIRLIPTPLSQCLLGKNTPTGTRITEWFEAYEGFEAPHRAQGDEPATEPNLAFNNTDEGDGDGMGDYETE